MAAAHGFRGVRDDLSELGHLLLDIACFLSPILAAAPAHNDSPPPSPRLFLPTNPHPRRRSTLRLRRRPSPSPSPRPPSARVLAGIISDLAEIGGSLRSGLSRLSAVFMGPVHEEEEEIEVGQHYSRPSESRAAEVVGVSEEVRDFVRDLVKCPESWLEFPVIVNDEFPMSQIQREHVEAMERFTPELADLQSSLCPSYMSEESFWRIYFALLNPRLSKHDSEKLLTQQIVDSLRITLKGMQNRLPSPSKSLKAHSSTSAMSDKGSCSQQEVSQVWRHLMAARTRSQQSIDQFSEVPSIVDAPSKGTNQFKTEDALSRTMDDGNLLMIDKYMDSLITDIVEVVSSPSPSRRKLVSVSDEDNGAVRISQVKMHSDAESSDWHRLDDSDFEMVDRT